MKTLHINLFKKWFDLTHKGIKIEDYREITPYWCSRLLMQNNRVEKQEFWEEYLRIYGTEILASAFRNKIKVHRLNARSYDTTTISNGYAKDRPQFVLENNGLEIRTGKAEWGAEEGKLYFVIKHGDGIVSNFG